MKKLFIISLACLVGSACAAPKPEKAAPAKKRPAAEAATPAKPAQPEPPKERKPGFWERAWESTKKGTGKVWNTTKRAGSKTVETVTSPFGGKKSKGDQPKAGWRQLGMGITTEPAQVKLPGTNSVRVSVAVTNRGKHAVQLDFPTTKRVEVVLKTDGGDVLSRATETQKTDSEQGFVVLNPSERLEYTASLSTKGMKAGQSYTIEAYFPDYTQVRATKAISPVN